MNELANDNIRTLMITAVVNLVGGALAVCAAVYLARFKWNFMRELDERFLKKPELEADLPLSRREAILIKEEHEKTHARFDKELDQLWSRVNRSKP